MPSILGSGMTISGNLEGDGVVQIEGIVDGDVRCGEVTIGQGGDVRGQIEADTVNVHGKVTGEIRARRALLAATAHVTGNIVHEELSIETGAFVEGQLQRSNSTQTRLNLVDQNEAENQI